MLEKDTIYIWPTGVPLGNHRPEVYIFKKLTSSWC